MNRNDLPEVLILSIVWTATAICAAVMGILIFFAIRAEQYLDAIGPSIGLSLLLILSLALWLLRTKTKGAKDDNSKTDKLLS